MNVLALIIAGGAAFVLQYLLTFVQMKSFTLHYGELRKMGRVAIGKKRGAFQAGSIAMLALDDDGVILDGRYMQGVTVFARFKAFKKDQGFEGKNIGDLDKEDCKSRNLSRPLSAAVLDAVSNYKTIMAGGEVPETPSPLKRLGLSITGLFKNVIKTGTTVKN